MEKTLTCEKCKSSISGKPEKASLPAVDPNGTNLLVTFVLCKACYDAIPTEKADRRNTLLELLKSRDPNAVIVLERG